MDWDYVATSERRQQILSGYAQLQVGQSREQVRAVMGPPDYAVPAYERSSEKFVGWHYTYRIRTTQWMSTAYDEYVYVAFDPSSDQLMCANGGPGCKLKDIGAPR